MCVFFRIEVLVCGDVSCVCLSWCILPSVDEISAADFSSDKLLNNLILCVYLDKILI